MKLIGYLISLLLFISLGLNFYFLRKSYPLTKTVSNIKLVTVAKVFDGDTFDTQENERIRIFEIDAPEYPKGCLSIESKVRLEDLILNKKVEIESIKKDNFGRTLAYVYLDKLLINELITEEGFAYYFKDKNLNTYSLAIEKAETKAKLSGRGVWSSLCSSKKKDCLIKGNYRAADTTRIYHTPDCYNYDKITIKPGTSDRWFCTESEAKQAGFIKSKDCP